MLIRLTRKHVARRRFAVHRFILDFLLVIITKKPIQTVWKSVGAAPRSDMIDEGRNGVIWIKNTPHPEGLFPGRPETLWPEAGRPFPKQKSHEGFRSEMVRLVGLKTQDSPAQKIPCGKPVIYFSPP